MSSKFILLILLIFSNITLVNSQTQINAREFYNLAYSLCESHASDIQMYNLQASDLDTSGKYQNWNCQLLSFQENEVYCYTYQSDSVLLDTIMVIPIGPSIVDSNWINSDKAVFIAEQNGGKAYRNQNKNYQINAYLRSRPSPPFYTYWDIKYIDLDSMEATFDIRINAVTEDIISSIENDSKDKIVLWFTFYSNYPNPFNNSTFFQFRLDKRSKVKLKIYDLYGRELEEIMDGILSPNLYKINWEAENYSSGMYFYSLFVDNEVITKKMSIIK